MEMIKELMKSALSEMADKATMLYSHYGYDDYWSEKRELMVEYGAKFGRIVMVEYGRDKAVVSRSAFGFVVLVDGKFPAGTLLKAASWKTPALNFARGDIFTPDSIRKAVTFWGSIG